MRKLNVGEVKLLSQYNKLNVSSKQSQMLDCRLLEERVARLLPLLQDSERAWLTTGNQLTKNDLKKTNSEKNKNYAWYKQVGRQRLLGLLFVFVLRNQTY